MNRKCQFEIALKQDLTLSTSGFAEKKVAQCRIPILATQNLFGQLEYAVFLYRQTTSQQGQCYTFTIILEFLIDILVGFLE